jgi:hypothetical protein
MSGTVCEDLLPFILGGDVELHISAHLADLVSGCWDGRGGSNNTQTHHKVTLYVQRLSFTYMAELHDGVLQALAWMSLF